LLVTASGMQILARAQHFTKPPRTAATAQPCDIYASAGTPCVAAHSTTRALYAGYRGPLYQVKRIADGATLDIRPAALHVGEQVAYADAAAQDDFCSHALCVLNIIYDQSGRGNNLYQAAPGTFKGPAKGGFDTQPIADMAPVSIHSHKVYGAYFMPGMGLRTPRSFPPKTSRKASTSSWTARTSTTVAVSTTATPPPTAVPSAPVPWTPPTSAAPPCGERVRAQVPGS
jgi:hypothetical protein